MWFLVAIFFALSVSVFGDLRENIISSYASQVVEGQRIVVEQSEKGTKVRYEKILRKGYNEIIKVVAPDFFEWAYLNGKTYVVFENEMKRSPAMIVDMERKFMKCLSSTPTELSTAVVDYNGNKAYKVEVKNKSATYVGIFLKSSFLLVKLSVQRANGQLTITYNSIKKVPTFYFEKVIDKFKVIDTPPSAMEIEVWKMIYHLNNVSITSIRVNDISIVLVKGVAKSVGEVVVYLFEGKRISMGNLVSQFKSKGFSSLSAEEKGINMVFVSKIKDVQKLKEWVKSILKGSSF